MMHDQIGVKQEEFQDLLDNISTATVTNGSHWMHVLRSPYASASLKLDKYILEEVKKYIHSTRTQQGAFSRKPIKELLKPHTNRKYILITDIRSYFESIKFEDISDHISSWAATANFVDIIRDFYFTASNELKRGLKASAPISELVGLQIDAIINSILHSGSQDQYVYSRYYDDIIISDDNKENLKLIKARIEDSLYAQLGLKLNATKTRLRHLQGVKVLGLRFHNGQILVSQSFKKKVRSIIHEYEHALYDESNLNGVHDAKSHVGTIIGSIRHLLDNSDSENTQYESKLAEYYDELERLESIRQELVEEGVEYK